MTDQLLGPQSNLPVPPAPAQQSNSQPVPASLSPKEVEDELNKVELKEIITQVEHILLRFLSYILLLHGFLSLYNEIILLFYAFPYIPDVYISEGFSNSIYQSIYRRTTIIVTTATLETIYGFILIKKHHSLAHRVHILSTIGLFIVSFAIQYFFGSFDKLVLDYISTPPLVENIISQNSIDGIFLLFLR